MSRITLSGNASGTGNFTLASPNSNTDQTLTLPDLSGSVVLNEGSGTFKIDSSGKVGIGTDTPENPLHVKSALDRIAVFESTDSSSAILVIDNNTTGGSDAEHGLNAVGDQLEVRAVGNVAFETNGVERARIDSAGNVLVGKTSADTSTVGVEALASGEMNATVNGGRVISLNRLGSDGEIIRLRKDGTTVGNIACISTGMQIYATGVNNTGWSFGDGSAVIPMKNSGLSDNAVDLGSASYRMDDIYATNNVIQTSDRNEKTDIEELDEAERRVAVACKGLIRKYRWKSSVEEKGDDARIHVGIIAQDLQAAFAADGLDAGRYAMFISSTWWELDGKIYETAEEAPEGATERTRLGVRYPELLAFIISAL